VDVFSILSFFSLCGNFPKAHALIPIDMSGDGNQRGHTQMFEGHTQQTKTHFKRGHTLFEGCTQQTTTHFKRGRTFLPNAHCLKTHENKQIMDRVHQLTKWKMQRRKRGFRKTSSNILEKNVSFNNTGRLLTKIIVSN